jgi:LPPG:FO 2-phospho-L-lactate transferase
MTPRVLALCGGVGGAKLALGFAKIMSPGDFAVVVNTGDDFEYLGLHISPDIDTVLYTLSDRASQVRGWGREDESWNFKAALAELGVDSWFSLGDRDLAVHILRSLRLKQGQRLTEITLDMARAFGITALILPMTDSPVATLIETDEGPLPFQSYFVERKCEPVVRRIQFQGASHATLGSELIAALDSTRLEAIVICPSNPYLSIDPILAVPGISAYLRSRRVPVIAITPIIAGKAVKGPTDKIMRELGVAPAATSVVSHYGDLLDGFVMDLRDRGDLMPPNQRVLYADTLMSSLDDRRRLASQALEFARGLAARC